MSSAKRYFYRHYLQFESHESVETLNETTTAILDHFKDQLTKSTIKVFKTIARYSCVIVGVSWLKNDTLAEILGINEKTVRRAYKALEQLGIIKVIPQTRQTGGRSYNLIIIQPIDRILSERLTAEKASNDKDINKEVKEQTNKAKILNNVTDEMIESDPTYIDNGKIDQTFLKLAKCFFNNKMVKTLWDRTQLAFRLYSSISRIDIMIVIKSLKNAVYAYKSGNIKKDFIGYFWGVLKNQIEDMEHEIAAQIRRQSGIELSNWL